MVLRVLVVDDEPAVTSTTTENAPAPTTTTTAVVTVATVAAAAAAADVDDPKKSCSTLSLVLGITGGGDILSPPSWSRRPEEEEDDEDDDDKGGNAGGGTSAAVLVPTPKEAPPNNHNNSNINKKKQKGRLKKLLKRAHSLDCQKDVSGIVESSEWNELQELLLLVDVDGVDEERDRRTPTNLVRTHHEQQQQQQTHSQQEQPGSGDHHGQQQRRRSSRILPSPRLSWRRGNKNNHKEPPVAVEGTDHRDLLFRLVWPRKRKMEAVAHQEEEENSHHHHHHHRGVKPHDCCWDDQPTNLLTPPRLPSWVSIHNPAQIGQAALLEFQCSTVTQYQTLQLALDQWDDCFSVPTKWFVGLHHPKSAAHTLLYAAPPKPRKTKHNILLLPRLESMHDLHQALSSLAVSEASMKAEGYPCGFLVATSDEDDPSNTDSSDRINPESQHIATERQDLDDDNEDVDALLAIPELEAAQLRVKKALVPVVSNVANGNVQSYIGTPTACSASLGATNNKAPPRRVLGLDCEMVETTLGRELARVTLVELTDFEPALTSRVRMDHLVQPRGTVLNFLTEYSGITATLLQSGPTADLVQIQAALLDFVSFNDVLVGHSLENDLHALQWVHPTVVDTALLLRADNAKYKHSLRHLAANLLQKQIQQGSHCSCEDANTALELAVRRVVRGPSFARHLMRVQPTNQLVALSRHGPVVCLGPPDWLRQHADARSAIHALSCDSVTHPNHKALVSWLTTTNTVRRAKLVVGSWTLPDDTEVTADPALPVQEILTLLKTLRAQLDSTSMICVALQTGLQRTVHLTEERRARMNPKASMAWTDKEQEQWSKMIDNCRNGKVYWMAGIKGTEPQTAG